MKNLDGTDNLDGSMAFGTYPVMPDGSRVQVTRGGPMRGKRGTVHAQEGRTISYPPGQPVTIYFVEMDDPVRDGEDGGRRVAGVPQLPLAVIEWEDYEIAPLGIVEWLAELASQGHEGTDRLPPPPGAPLGPTTRPTA